MDDQFAKDDDEIETPFTIFKWTRILLLVLSTAILLLCVIGLFFSVFGGGILTLPSGWSFTLLTPENFGLSVILPMSLISTVVLALPWENENITISQIGPIALGRKIEGQAHAQEIGLAEIQNEIQSIRDAISNSASGDKTSGKEKEKSQIPTDLEKMLLEFLSKFDRWAFSPSRINLYGSKQEGFEDFSTHSVSQIRSTLRQLVLQKKLATRVSKKGNTLYRIPN